MQPKSRKLLWDIGDQASFITELTNGLTFEEFMEQRQTRMAVERGLEVIGEASRRLVELDSELASQIPALQSAIGMRNIIAHQYDGINYALLWGAVRGPVQGLGQVVASLLSTQEAE